MAYSGIPVEIFSTYIVEKLRKTNPHMECAHDESSHVLGGSVVHIPQAGARPAVVKNRQDFPATAIRREDSSVTYPLDVFTTDPTHVSWAEENESSYSKTDSVLNDHVETLVESIGDEIIYKWVKGKIRQSNGSYSDDVIPADHIIRTSGQPVDVNPNDKQQGQRKALTAADLAKAQSMMNKLNVPKENRYILIESYMYQQLLDSLSTNQMAAFAQTADLANGVVGRLHGFNILERSSVIMFTKAGQPIAPGTEATGDGSDNIAAIAWQKDCVAVAKGDVKPFQETDSPTYYGDIFSALIKAGGRARRANCDGVLAIVQDAVADEMSQAAALQDDNVQSDGGEEDPQNV